jgi:hypothetical protein
VGERETERNEKKNFKINMFIPDFLIEVSQYSSFVLFIVNDYYYYYYCCLNNGIEKDCGSICLLISRKQQQTTTKKDKLSDKSIK